MEQQMKIFQVKFDQEDDQLKECKNSLNKLKEDKFKEKENLQKVIQTLQKNLQEKANQVKEKEESNAILRKETMDLVARYSVNYAPETFKM